MGSERQIKKETLIFKDIFLLLIVWHQLELINNDNTLTPNRPARTANIVSRYALKLPRYKEEKMWESTIKHSISILFLCLIFILCRVSSLPTWQMVDQLMEVTQTKDIMFIRNDAIFVSKFKAQHSGSFCVSLFVGLIKRSEQVDTLN